MNFEMIAEALVAGWVGGVVAIAYAWHKFHRHWHDDPEPALPKCPICEHDLPNWNPNP